MDKVAGELTSGTFRSGKARSTGFCRCETAYAAAGADGFFVPGLTQPALIRRIVKATDLPVNVMMRGELTSLGEVASLGAARASYGPGPYLKAMEDLAARFKALH